jgi:hypothetical protein
MAKALPWEHRSPGLWKGVETGNHEPHRRKSRMREIRSSGSGEGPGRVTSRPTLQRSFGTAPSAAPWASHPPHPELVRATTNVGWCWTGVSGWVRETP